MGAFGECLPYEDNHESLHPTKVDRFGIPQLVFNVTFRDNELRMMADASQQVEMMLRKAGLRNVTSYEHNKRPGEAIYTKGGEPIGADQRESGFTKREQ